MFYYLYNRYSRNSLIKACRLDIKTAYNNLQNILQSYLNH